MSEFTKREAINRLQATAQLLDDAMSTVSFTFTAGAANVANVKISCLDADGNVIAVPRNLTIYLSDASTGLGITGTAASGTVQAKSASGTDLAVLVAKKALIAQTLADGTYTLEITATGKTAYYVVVIDPLTGKPIVSRVMATGDYGA